MCVCVYIYTYKHTHTHMYSVCVCTGLLGSVFTNGLGDQGSIPGQVIPKTQKIGIWCLLA